MVVAAPHSLSPYTALKYHEHSVEQPAPASPSPLGLTKQSSPCLQDVLGRHIPLSPVRGGILQKETSPRHFIKTAARGERPNSHLWFPKQSHSESCWRKDKCPGWDNRRTHLNLRSCLKQQEQHGETEQQQDKVRVCVLAWSRALRALLSSSTWPPCTTPEGDTLKQSQH